MKLAQTILSKLRRSDLFVENGPAQALQLRRSDIFCHSQTGATAKYAKYANGIFSRGSRGSRLKSDVAPTELEIILDPVATNMPRLRRSGLSRRDSLKIARRFNAGNGSVCASSPAGTAEPARSFRSSLRDSNHFAAQPGVETPGYCRSSLRDKTADGFSLTPWLQPGVQRGTGIGNRFNGLPAHGEAVETAGSFSTFAIHRAEATVLMRMEN